jgi:hypothetical protein
MGQLHKTFTDEQVKDLLQRYLDKQIERKYLQEIFKIKKAHFFRLLKAYRFDPDNFSIRYERKSAAKINKSTESNIIKELKRDKNLIENKDTTLCWYNYSYVQRRLEDHYQQRVSLPTIIKRAKEHGFYLPKKPKKKLHDREVLTHYAGELIQHDTSYHLWAPAADKKWCLISSLDDYSRFIIYAKLVTRESSWAHIQALRSTILTYGCPYSYYVDCHSIFRYVKGRDQKHHQYNYFTDDISPQWKQVLEECNVKVTYALSPQAKGKIERPFGWMQDNMIRSCDRNNVKDIHHANRILDQEIKRYNFKTIHSTTQEIPYRRFQNAIDNKKSLFRKFFVPKPYLLPKDIFCLRLQRTVDNYRTVSIDKLKLKVNCDDTRIAVDIRIHLLSDKLAELRFWYRDRLIDTKRVKTTDLPLSAFDL